ncbi:MAG: hypothetical protein CME24_10430 [Gemmatimonadetes bacterium]|nr:hypothetical protein [Gemmatimonadota bacterium]
MDAAIGIAHRAAVADARQTGGRGEAPGEAFFRQRSEGPAVDDDLILCKGTEPALWGKVDVGLRRVGAKARNRENDEGRVRRVERSTAQGETLGALVGDGTGEVDADQSLGGTDAFVAISRLCRRNGGDLSPEGKEVVGKGGLRTTNPTTDGDGVFGSRYEIDRRERHREGGRIVEELVGR